MGRSSPNDLHVSGALTRDDSAVDQLLQHGGEAVLLNHPLGSSSLLSVAHALRRALAGETRSFSAIVGYFHHRAAWGGAEGAGSEAHVDDPAQIIIDEAAEEGLRSAGLDASECGFRLLSGAICSEEAALAARLWYWACRWRRQGADQGAKAAAYRDAFLGRVSDLGPGGDNFVKASLELLSTDGGSPSIVGPLQLGDAFADSLDLVGKEARDDVRTAWTALRCSIGHASLPTGSKADIAPLTGKRASMMRATATLYAFLLLRQGDFKVAPAGRRIGTGYEDHLSMLATFHPKIYVVERGGTSPTTACIMGSSNWSSSALGLRSVGDSGGVRGNVEVSTLHVAPRHLWSEAAGDDQAPGIAGKACRVARYIFENTGRWVGSWSRPYEIEDVFEVQGSLTHVSRPPGTGGAEAPSEPPPPPQRASIDECSALEKAWLLLHDLLSQTVGEQLGLHPRAVTYQPVAYQRLGAERVLHHLDQYSGAMLCDGVGLGKTYIATTLMVHYANRHQEGVQTRGAPAPPDPFRITVLSPNSVVGTWLREAVAPLAAYGVPRSSVRVLPHSALSTLKSNSSVLIPGDSELSDIAHLLLSDLVVVDEAHNFRSETANRTKLLRELLRLQPRRDRLRRVLLLTATPINNSMADLRQQLALMFSEPAWLSDRAASKKKYRRSAIAAVLARVEEARTAATGDAAALVAFGRPDETFTTRIGFRGSLDLGSGLPDLDHYLRDQEALLAERQQLARGETFEGDKDGQPLRRVAGDLLDKIVVQRSRARCKEIEVESGSTNQPLFRPNADKPRPVIYEDVYEGTRDVMRRLLPLFERSEDAGSSNRVLTFKVHAWSLVRAGSQNPDRESTVIGLQRVLALKRLESSPVTFLITLLRLLTLHAHRLSGLAQLSAQTRQRSRRSQLDRTVTQAFAKTGDEALKRLDLLITGHDSGARGMDMLARWSAAHLSSVSTASADELPSQLALFQAESEPKGDAKEELDRLWGLYNDLSSDFATLLETTPSMAHLVFGQFAADDWPLRFIAGGTDIEWPTSAEWAQRLVTDGKLRRLVGELLRATADGQKVIVFSQFTDTIAYVGSVLRALDLSPAAAWKGVLAKLKKEVGGKVTASAVRSLARRMESVTGDTDDREAVVDAFAPFYRLGPFPPPATESLLDAAGSPSERWRDGWTRAMREPVNVLLASDVLAEGVNLQDVSLLINYDIHWNPVRMIQRAGRIDRRLKPSVEGTRTFPALSHLASEIGAAVPTYWWHEHREEAPETVNLLLPRELEEQLHLRERISTKTLAIDLTLGLERGTGAESDWMKSYRYHGIAALESWQRDHGVEVAARQLARIRAKLAARGIDPAWAVLWNGWLREMDVDEGGEVLASARLGSLTERAEYTRFLTPRVVDGIGHWLWTLHDPTDSQLNEWLALDGSTRPPNNVRTGLTWDRDASRPVTVDDLSAFAVRLLESQPALQERGEERGLLLQQGITAVSAGRYGRHRGEREPANLRIESYRILQLAKARIELRSKSRTAT